MARVTPREAQGSAGRLRLATQALQACWRRPGRREAQGGPERRREAQGSPGRPREAQGGPQGGPREAQGGPGKPREGQGRQGLPFAKGGAHVSPYR